MQMKHKCAACQGNNCKSFSIAVNQMRDRITTRLIDRMTEVKYFQIQKTAQR